MSKSSLPHPLPQPLQWEPSVTRVFVVVMEKNGHTLMLGATTAVMDKPQPDPSRKKVWLVLKMPQDEIPFTMVYLNKEKADAVFHEELHEYIRFGYTVQGEPKIIGMNREPWLHDAVHVWAAEVFNRATGMVR